MKYMSHDDIRKTWFRFFENKKHKRFESAPLVPINDALSYILWSCSVKNLNHVFLISLWLIYFIINHLTSLIFPVFYQ